MINRFFSKKGKGAPQVSLTIDQPHVRSGETVTGQVIVKGGTSEQVLDKLHVHLLFFAKVGSEQANSIVHTIDQAASHPLAAKAELRLPFSYQLPELPQSSHYVRYRLQTTVEVAGTEGKQGVVDLTLLPSETLRLAQNAWRALGFKDLPLSGSFNGAVQIFEYEVTKPALKKRISEPQAVFLPETDGVRMHLAYNTPDAPYPLYGSVHLTGEQLQSREGTQRVLHDFLELQLTSPTPNNVPTLPVFEKKLDLRSDKAQGSPLLQDIAVKSIYPFGAVTFTTVIAMGEPGMHAGRGLFEPFPFDAGTPGSAAHGTGSGVDVGVSGFDAGSLGGGGSFDGGSSTNL